MEFSGKIHVRNAKKQQRAPQSQEKQTKEKWYQLGPGSPWEYI
jgi:hypothetical protein